MLRVPLLVHGGPSKSGVPESQPSYVTQRVAAAARVDGYPPPLSSNPQACHSASQGWDATLLECAG